MNTLDFKLLRKLFQIITKKQLYLKYIYLYIKCLNFIDLILLLKIKDIKMTYTSILYIISHFVFLMITKQKRHELLLE